MYVHFSLCMREKSDAFGICCSCDAQTGHLPLSPSRMVWNRQVELPHKQVTGDRVRVKPCQLVRNLPGGGLAGFTLWEPSDR